MSKSKIKYLIVLIFLLSGCMSAKIPKQNVPKLNKVAESVYGSWTVVFLNRIDTNMTQQEIEGELITCESDKLLILQKSGMLNSVGSNDIESANLYIYRDQAGLYAGLTIALYIPSIIGALVIQQPAFLIFGLPGLITGFILAAVEASNKSNMLEFPDENDLNDFKPFARFPQGMPENIDLKDFVLTN